MKLDFLDIADGNGATATTTATYKKLSEIVENFPETIIMEPRRPTGIDYRGRLDGVRVVVGFEPSNVILKGNSVQEKLESFRKAVNYLLTIAKENFSEEEISELQVISTKRLLYIMFRRQNDKIKIEISTSGTRAYSTIKRARNKQHEYREAKELNVNFNIKVQEFIKSISIKGLSRREQE